MNSNKNKLDRKIILSALWIFVMLNYLYCDVMGLMDSQLLKHIIAGYAADGKTQITPEFLLMGAILMEIPMVMIFLSRVLNYPVNRWANIIAGIIMSIVQSLSLFVGTPAIYYIFCSVIEISCTMFILFFALRWKKS